MRRRVSSRRRERISSTRRSRPDVEPVDLLVAGESVAPELLGEVSTLGHAPRVIGVFRRDDLPRGTRDVTVALWHVGDPGNVGTLVRTADAFGAGVALSDECADPVGPRALRASAGAIFRVPLCGWDEAQGRRIALVAHGGEPLSTVALEPARHLPSRCGARRAAGDPVAQSHEAATITLPGDAESLNVAVAGAIVLYELSRRATAI